MQHDPFTNPATRTRRAFPYIAVLQADLASEGHGRIVAPLAPRHSTPDAVGRSCPLYTTMAPSSCSPLELMTTVPVRALRQKRGSIAQYRDDIARALEWLFTGV
jgi:hypothetical protein